MSNVTSSHSQRERVKHEHCSLFESILCFARQNFELFLKPESIFTTSSSILLVVVYYYYYPVSLPQTQK